MQTLYKSSTSKLRGATAYSLMLPSWHWIEDRQYWREWNAERKATECSYSASITTRSRGTSRRGITSSTMVHEFMEPIQFFKHQVSEAYLLVTQQDTANSIKKSNRTKGGSEWSQEGSHVLNDSIIREIRAFHPLEPWRLLCSIHQQAWGGKA